MQLTLTPEERQLLIEVVEERHRELLREISRSTHYQFKITLKQNEMLLQSVITKLNVMQPGGVAASL